MPEDYMLPEAAAPDLKLPESLSMPEHPGAMGAAPGLGELRALVELGGGLSEEAVAEITLGGGAGESGHGEPGFEAGAFAAEAGLEEALAAVDLERMTADDIALLEHGNEEQVRSVLRLQQDHPDYEAGAPGRVSIKAMSAADRVRTVRALDMIRAGVAPGEAFAEVFGDAGAYEGHAAAEGGPADPFAPEGGHDDEGHDAGAYGDEESYYQGADDPQAESYATEESYEGPAGLPEAQVQELEGRLEDLKERYDAARAMYDPAAADLLEEMQDVKLDLREAQRESAGYAEAQDESRGRALNECADLLRAPQSGFVEFCEAEIVLAERRNDPMFRTPDWPEKIGQRVRDKYFPGGAARSAPAAARYASHHQMVPPAPHQRVRIPGSPVGIGFSAGTLSSETAVAEFERLSPEGQDAALAEIEKLSRRRR